MKYVYAPALLVAFYLGLKFLVLLWRTLGLPNFRKPVYFRDSYNRIKIYRGVNVCNYSKTSPDLLPWHTRQDYERLKLWGFNLVRFLVFWEALEPKKGEYNLEYVNKVKEHLSILNDLGIDVIIDLHQDLYSRKFSGNGFPDWALPSKESPFKLQKKWFMNYFQPAVMDCYKHFWSNKELKDKYVELIQFVNKNLVVSMPNVLGIDVLNEPFPNFPFICKFEKNVLSDFYEQIKSLNITSNLNSSLFFESWILTSAGVPTYVKSRVFNEKHKHMPHYYPPFSHYEGNYSKFNSFLTRVALKSKAIEARRLGSPALIGEIAIVPEVKNSEKFIDDLLNASEKYHINWMWYTYDLDVHDTQGLLDKNKEPKDNLFRLLRIYPQKIAGKNPKFKTIGRSFVFECDYDETTSEQTEIFVLPQQKYTVKSNVKHTVEGNILKFENVNEKTFIRIDF